MNRRRFAGALAAASLVVPRRARAAAAYTLKWAHATQPEHPLAYNAVRVRDAVRARTGGRLEIELFGNNVLGGDPAMLSQVRAGAIQLYSGYGGAYEGIAPLAGIEGIGFAFTS